MSVRAVDRARVVIVDLPPLAGEADAGVPDAHGPNTEVGRHERRQHDNGSGGQRDGLHVGEGRLLTEALVESAGLVLWRIDGR